FGGSGEGLAAFGVGGVGGLDAGADSNGGEPHAAGGGALFNVAFGGGFVGGQGDLLHAGEVVVAHHEAGADGSDEELLRGEAAGLAAVFGGSVGGGFEAAGEADGGGGVAGAGNGVAE